MPSVGMRPLTETESINAIWRAVRRLGTPVAVSSVENVNVVTASGSTQTLPDVDQYTMHKVTLTAACVITGPTPIAGGSFTLWLIQDGTGSRVPTFGATFKFAAGAAPTFSTGAGKRDVIAFACVDGAQWDDLGYRLDVR